ncbi:MAG: 30S ribosomal protein S21 [Thermodesulfobacteriota bacterium]
MEIKVYNNNIEKAMRDLKRGLERAGIFRELRRRRFYEKPSEKKKRKQAEAKKRLRRAERKELFV